MKKLKSNNELIFIKEKIKINKSFLSKFIVL